MTTTTPSSADRKQDLGAAPSIAAATQILALCATATTVFRDAPRSEIYVLVPACLVVGLVLLALTRLVARRRVKLWQVLAVSLPLMALGALGFVSQRPVPPSPPSARVFLSKYGHATLLVLAFDGEAVYGFEADVGKRDDAEGPRKGGDLYQYKGGRYAIDPTVALPNVESGEVITWYRCSREHEIVTKTGEPKTEKIADVLLALSTDRTSGKARLRRWYDSASHVPPGAVVWSPTGDHPEFVEADLRGRK